MISVTFTKIVLVVVVVLKKQVLNRLLKHNLCLFVMAYYKVTRLIKIVQVETTPED